MIMERQVFASALKNVRLKEFVWPDPDDASDLRIIKNVVEQGCHIIAVEEDEGTPRFAYSIGLYLNYLHPEIVIVEMDHASAGRVINSVAAKLKAGEKFDPETPYEGLHETLPLVFREIRMEDHLDELGFAIWFYCSRSRGLRFPVYQAMWPDRAGRFPTDSRCDARVIKAQQLRRK